MTAAAHQDCCPDCGIEPGYSHYKRCEFTGIVRQPTPPERVATGVASAQADLATMPSLQEVRDRATGVDTAHVLVEAERLIHGDRNESYGPPWEDYERTTAAFKALTGHDLSAIDGMTFMLCVKLSRQQNSAARDNLVDAAGYIGCIADTIDHYEETIS